MEQSTSKRRLKPTLVCQYGKDCYRKNPHHFMQYLHDHLDKIIEENSAEKNVEQYKISDKSVAAQRDLIIDQIKIINQLFPESVPSSKKNKLDVTHQSTSTSSDSVDGCIASRSLDDANSKALPKVNIHDYIKVVVPKSKMAEKLAAARPYNYFLTSITSSTPTHNEQLSITFQEILDPSLGELECSVQINFMVDIGLYNNLYFDCLPYA